MLPLPSVAGEITVKPGETLSEIADRLGISMKRLMELNGISKADHVEVGQKLKVPGRVGSNSRSSGGGAVAAGRVTVREGDTLSEIAVRQGMTLNELMALNNISKADHVEAGQTLKVTGKVVTAAEPAPFRKGASSHLVRSGESLSKIAEGYGVPMSRLVAINAISDPNHVEVGTQLKLKGEPAEPRPVQVAAPRPTPSPAPRERPIQAAAPRPEAPAAAELPKTSQPVVTQAAASAINAAPAAAATWQAAPATTASRPIVPMAAPVRTTPVATTPIAAPAAAATIPVTAAMPTPRPSSVASSFTPRPVAAQTTTPTWAAAPGRAAAPAAASAPATAVATSSWRRYGPLQVDWSNWQPMGGSLVAPILNAKGDTLYLAINCGARKMNATSAAGDWSTWDDPRADFERRLVNELCSSRG
jgi:LysM repeat protein